MVTDKLAVVDFGGQYTQLIARRIRDMSVYSEIVSCAEPVATVLRGGYKGVILSGGPSSVYEDNGCSVATSCPPTGGSTARPR